MWRWIVLSVFIAACGCVSPQGHGTFQAQFDHFYPDDPQYVTKMYRDAYIKCMRDPAHSGRLGAAINGDQAVLKRYLLRATAEKNKLDGEYAETYAYDIRFLLIRVGDRAFAQALRELAAPEREEVAHYLDCLICRERGWFPETTSLYNYRWKTPNQALQPTGVR